MALPHVMYNVVKLPGQTAGFLGPAYEPLQVTKDPNAADFRVGEIELPAGVDAWPSWKTARRCWPRVNAQMDAAPGNGGPGTMNAYYERAFNLLRCDAVRRSFDINQEDAATRERYGRNIHGQSALLGPAAGRRRACGSSACTTRCTTAWTTGTRTSTTSAGSRISLLPPCDMAFSALVEDLDARGLLDSTLVIMLGEFGRTPKINGQGGRDHWPDCYSVVMAGGGVTGGAMYGSSDKIGAYPDLNPVTPGDLAATIFWRFGLDPPTELHDVNGRPFRLAAGEPIHELFA